ncbi:MULTISPECIES: hypothetical protein [Streptomyces]|uniref:hypothetical protein n=1 Tax=Streptomyces TaxID=1883 RepID=UPI0036AC9F98
MRLGPADEVAGLSGRRDTGVAGTKEECFAHIDEVWSDQRPLSVRQFRVTRPGEPAAASASTGATSPASWTSRSS